MYRDVLIDNIPNILRFNRSDLTFNKFVRMLNYIDDFKGLYLWVEVNSSINDEIVPVGFPNANIKCNEKRLIWNSSKDPNNRKKWDVYSEYRYGKYLQVSYKVKGGRIETLNKRELLLWLEHFKTCKFYTTEEMNFKEKSRLK